MTKLNRVIKEKGYKKGFVAEKAGISFTALSRIAKGHTKDPRTSVALKIARALDMSVEELFGEVTNDD